MRRLSLQPHQWMQAGLSTGVGGRGLASVTRRVSAPAGCECEMPPMLLSDFSGLAVRAPGVNCLEHHWYAPWEGSFASWHGRAPTGDWATVLLPEIVEWAHGDRNREGCSESHRIEVLRIHDSAGPDSRRLQGKSAIELCSAKRALVALPEGDGRRRRMNLMRG